jgi:pimeloyl-ACP methyl ester carboxylesterase
MVIPGIFPVSDAELYAAKPETSTGWPHCSGRPTQPLDAFMRQSNAVIAHDVERQLGKISAPTQITFGRSDLITSTRFADPMTSQIRRTELIVFDGCSHAPIYEKVEEFNQRTLSFLQRHSA